LRQSNLQIGFSRPAESKKQNNEMKLVTAEQRHFVTITEIIMVKVHYEHRDGSKLECTDAEKQNAGMDAT